jgi:acyl-coenzyme A synthetase/AMP-(fatty) acid ligase
VVWGTNESHTSTITRLNQEPDGIETVGHPLPGVRLEVVSSLGVPLPIGARGLIRVASDSCVKGYLDDDELTQLSFREGWFYTGDIGYMADSGELVHLGRSDNMMIVNGINLFPSEVERCLRSYPGVTDAVVAPIRNRLSQNLPIALISVSQGTAIDRRALLAFVHKTIGSYALYDFRLVRSIPRNDQGKLPKESLQAAIKKFWGTKP